MSRLLPIALLWALPPASAFAQQPPAAPPTGATGGQSAQTQPAPAEAREETVVVTARKREEEVIDIPAAVTSLGAEAIADQGGLRDIGDLAALAPGVQFTNTGNINAEFNIRGSGAGTVRTANTESPVAVLRDGSSVVVGNIGGRGYARSDLFDVERIEVIRGPQGVLYGQSTTGGVINAISKRPENAYGASLNTSYNTTVEAVAVEGVVNAPVIEDRLLLRAGLQHENRSGGHFTNVVSGKEGDIARYTGGRLSALARVTDTLEIFAVFDASDDQGPSNRVKSETLGLSDPDGPYVYGHNTFDRSDRELLSGTLNVDWDTALGLLTSVSTWRSRETTFLQDEDGSFPGYARRPTGGAGCMTQRACETLFGDDSELWGQEFRIDWTMPDRWTLLTGVNFEARTNNFYTVSSGRTVSATNLAVSPNANLASISYSHDNFYGVFATLGWDATDRLTLNAGARYSEALKKFESFQVRRNVGGVATGALCPFDKVIDVSYPAACRTPLFNDKRSTDNLSPAVSAIYAVTNDIRVFGNYARGFRAGGFNTTVDLINASPAPGEPRAEPSYGNEIGNAYELGIKGRGPASTLFSASYYLTQVDDLIVTLNSTDTLGQTRNFRDNAGQADLQGVDIEVSGRLRGPVRSGRFNYSAALNWFDGEYTSGPFEGTKVEGQPEWQGTLSGTYRQRIDELLGLFASASYRIQRGGLTATAGNTNQVDLIDLDDVNASIGVEGDSWRLTFQARNLLDNQDPILRDAVTAAFPGGQRLVYGNPREFLIRFEYRFGSES